MAITTIEELEKWCEGKTVEEIKKFINYNGNIVFETYEKLGGINLKEKAEILYNKVNNKQMEKELKITKEKVIEAANKCSTAKETLKTLFPEVFEEEKTWRYGNEIYDKSGTLSIIAQISSDLCCLVAIEGHIKGNRYRKPIEVTNSLNITKEELILMGADPNKL